MSIYARLWGGAVAVLLLAGLTWARQPTTWNEPEEFRGLKLGQNLKEHVRECPARHWEAKERCWKQVGPPDAHGMVMYDMHNFGPIGNLAGGTMLAEQWHDRLMFVAVTMTHDGYARLRDIVVQRYGPPTSERTEEVVTKAGVRWPNQIMSWQGSRVSLELIEHSGRADRTVLSAYTADFVEYQQRKRREERKKGERDL